MNEIKQLPSFNGWRAFSILLVLCQHIPFTDGFPSQYSSLVYRTVDGNLGVRVFFTISGFLITWLMVKEEKEFGCMSLSNFYLRRGLRILPVYLACILVMASLQLAGISSQKGFVWFQLLTFTRNFYETGHAECVLSAHFWSLSVEEQFYLIWPVIFLLLGRAPKRRIGFLIFLILISTGWKIIALLGFYSRHLSFLFEEDSTFLYLDCIAYGCIGAVLLDTNARGLKSFFEKFSRPIFFLSCLLLVTPEVAGLGMALQSFGFIFLLLQSVLLPECKPFKILNHRWLGGIGILSYSLYIWQQLIFVLWPFPRLWFLAFPMTFAAAWLSYNLLEKPFFALRSKLRRPRPHN